MAEYIKRTAVFEQFDIVELFKHLPDGCQRV